MPEYIIYSDKILPDLVRFWNESFAGERNFFPVTEEIFRKRIFGKRTALEHFDPNGLILAVDNDKIIGFIHAGINSEQFCFACYENWHGGRQGYMAMFYVAPVSRRKGVGSALFGKAKYYLQGTSQIIIDGQCLNPFYGNSEGPFTPFWGTSEGVSIKWTDVETRSFLSGQGFTPRYKGLSMEFDLSGFDVSSAGHPAKELARKGFVINSKERFYPILGGKQEDNISYPENYDYKCSFCVKDGRTVGIITTYPMKELSLGKYAIFELLVQDEYRNIGIGKALVIDALAGIAEKGGKTCETLTLPGLSAAGHELYNKIGFKQVYEWAIY